VDFKAFRKEFSGQIQQVSHHKLIDLTKELREVTHKRYGGGKPPKYELVERSFEPFELAQFMEAVEDPIDKACFTLMVRLALRINELTNLRGRDLQGDQLTVRGLKGGFSFPAIKLPPSLLSLIPCVGPDEKLFPRSAKQLRDRFAIYRLKANLNDVYAYTKPCGVRGTVNPRFRLSLHSLRHTGIQEFLKASGGNLILTQKFARHRKITTTMKYLKKNEKEEIEDLLEQICEPQIIKALEVTAKHGR